MILRPPRSHDPGGFARQDELNSIAGMPKPVIVSVDVAPPIDTVFAFLDVMANHEAFNDHLMKNWQQRTGARFAFGNDTFDDVAIKRNLITHTETPANLVENPRSKNGRIILLQKIRQYANHCSIDNHPQQSGPIHLHPENHLSIGT